MSIVLRLLLLIMIGQFALLSPAVAAGQLKRLSAAEIKSKIIGMVITDETHWSDGFCRKVIYSHFSLERKSPPP